MNNVLKAVILDWAGTTVDYGCMAPAGVFVEVFTRKGIEITWREARTPMGMHKRDHIAAIVAMPRVAAKWEALYGRTCNPEDVQEMFELFIPLQLAIIRKHSNLIPGTMGAINWLREQSIKIGSTTGYNNEMMQIVMEEASLQGYQPDALVCASDVPAGRPAPWMALRIAEQLGVFPMKHILKIGDTISDIQEGLNAGMWSAGIVESGNEMGLTEEEVASLSSIEKELRKTEIRTRFYEAGAHFVIDTPHQIPWLVGEVNLLLTQGRKP